MTKAATTLTEAIEILERARQTAYRAQHMLTYGGSQGSRGHKVDTADSTKCLSPLDDTKPMSRAALRRTTEKFHEAEGDTLPMSREELNKYRAKGK